MKTLFALFRKITLLLLVFTSVNISLAQTPTYLLKVANESQPSPNTYEFDVFLLSTGSTAFELHTFQFGLGYDVSILNGGTHSHSIVTTVNGNAGLPAPSELLPAQSPIILPPGGFLQIIDGVSYRFFNCAARTPPGAGSGTIISSVDGGCGTPGAYNAHPGTRVARYRLTNSVPFKANSTCKHVWSSTVGVNRTNTFPQAYIGFNGVNISSAANNINYNKNGSCIIQPNGLILNLTTCPTAIANGPYTTCGNVVHLNGFVGGPTTSGTWTSSTGGTFSPNANTLNAVYNLSATDIANGSVTLTLTSDNPDPLSCVAAVSQATVTLTSPNDGNACTVDACNTTNGNITHTPLPGINDGNPATVDACDSSTGIITHNLIAYQLRVANETQPSPNTYEFDVFLLSTGNAPLELNVLEFGLGYDVAILNGGTQSYSIVTTVNGNAGLPAPSELLPSQVPTSLPVGGSLQLFDGVSYRFFNCETSPPGAGNGTIISSVDGGCGTPGAFNGHPGTRIARYRLTNSVPFLANSTCKHVWSTTTGPNRTGPLVVPVGSFSSISSAANNINYNKNGSCLIQPNGLILNSATCPTAYANGPYTTCGNVVQLNGFIGGNATGGTWTSATGGTFSPNANTLNALYNLSTTDIANGSVTLTLTSDNPDPLSCVAAVSQATVTVTSHNDGNACTIDVCNTSNGSITHTPLPGIDDGNPATTDACDSSTGIITHDGPAYQLRVANESQPSPNTYEFDVFLLSTGNIAIELHTFQFGLGYDVAILNGGTQSYSIVTTVNGNAGLPAPSELLPSQVPTSLPVGGTLQSFNGVSYRFFNCATRLPPGSGFGTIISSVDGGCGTPGAYNGHPGTRIARFRLTNSVPFLANSTCKHVWNTTIGLNQTNTIIQAYIPPLSGTGVAANMTSAANNINHSNSGSCIIQPQGIILNLTPVTLNAKLFIQGFYTGGGLMDNYGSGGCLYYLGVSGATATDVDTVFISAMDPISFSEVDRQWGILKSNGNLSVTFGNAVSSGNSYYIKLEHRNSLETWSKLPVLFPLTTNYDFTTASMQAYDDGAGSIPMKLVDTSPNRWSIYNGDIDRNGEINSSDMTLIYDNSNSGFFGYYPTDLNGDGVSDSFDMTIVEGNAGLFDTHP